MKTRATTLSRLLVGTFALALLTPTFGLAQEDQSKQSKKEQKEQKNNDKDEKRLASTVRKYEEALAKAKDKYLKDDDFREDVDYEYRETLRQHAHNAFEFNTSDSNDWVTTYSGEKMPKGTDTMYDNMMAQDYVNRVGQSLVPDNSANRYGFKINVNPMPEARSLSTGTIYVSTGLLSLIDNEAQLAYVLGHEIAHVEEEHWKEDIMVAEYLEDAAKSAEKKGAIFGAIAGGVTGGLLGKSASGIAAGAFAGSLGGMLFAKLTRKSFEWSLAQEDEADKLALNYMMNRNYDVREVQSFYDGLRAASMEDPRIGLDKFGDRKRAEERRKAVDAYIKTAPSDKLAKTLLGAVNLRGKSITTDSSKGLSFDRNLTVTINRAAKNQEKMADELKARLASGEILAGDGEFENVMSAIKRDNGIVAFYFDMYKLAARNLNQALAIRSDDALGYLYYGKVLKLTARKPGEREQALQLFAKAIELDKRNANPESHLYFALTKMSGRMTNNVQETMQDLKEYVASYQQANGGILPPNMNVIYDFMLEAGDSTWSALPYTNIRDISPQPVSQQQPQPVVPAQSAPTVKKRP